MTQKPLHASITIEKLSDTVEYTEISDAPVTYTKYSTKYRATITVDFDNWIPAQIEHIAKTGILA